MLDLLLRCGAFRYRRRACRVLLACAATSACGGRLAPTDVTADAGDAAPVDAADSSTVVDSGEEEAGPLPCDYDAFAGYDAALCTPPANDVLYADPPVLSVAAGSYGLATFVAAGPWTQDPHIFMRYEGTTLPLRNVIYATSYGATQSIPFLVSASAGGQQGSFTVSAHAGNIERIAQVTVNVTSCVPNSQYCSGMECGFEGDGCGGLQSCGMCGGSTPYCHIYQCVSSPVTMCPPGYGYDIEGNRPMDCIPCAETVSCKKCKGGSCASLNSICYCNYGG